ncbi:hypothetical protein HUW46_02248 [Amycolatopsis sp. CA-230715]|nr:hypothetical protein HUW46_02248 [Amycolatopsis sp. CA-230715]
MPETGAGKAGAAVCAGSRSAACAATGQSEMDAATAIPSGGVAAEPCAQAGKPTAMASAHSTAAIVATARVTGEGARTRSRYPPRPVTGDRECARSHLVNVP